MTHTTYCTHFFGRTMGMMYRKAQSDGSRNDDNTEINSSRLQQHQGNGGGGRGGVVLDMMNRKKAMGLMKAWLLIDSTGGAQVVKVDKHAIMRRTGLLARDLRILDPILSYPSTILGRERAIIVNLEHIKAIITAQEVLLLNSLDPVVAQFAMDLQKRIQKEHAGALSDMDIETASKLSPSAAGLRNRYAGHIANLPHHSDCQIKQEWEAMDCKDLPFEFRALEVCLEVACGSLDSETANLEQEAYPALDELTSKISTLNLERVRQIKSRLVAISGRVQKVRDELEKLLDDDGDMAEMYLTDKLMGQHLATHSSLMSLGGINEFSELMEHEEDVSNVDEELSAMHGNGGVMHDTSASFVDSSGARVDSERSSSIDCSSSADSRHLDIEEIEMLLEAYFVQIDGTLNKLSALREYVDDTEDYINIMLDDKQNHLLQMGVLLTTATLVLSGFIVVTAVFGMNINIDLFETGTFEQFLWTIGGSAIACVLIYILLIGWCKWRRLLD